MDPRFEDRLIKLGRTFSERLDKGGGPPDDGGMEARITKLEEFATDARERLVRIETRLDQTATKADLHDSINTTSRWIVGTAIALGGMGITIMTFVLNNAIPKEKPPVPQPIAPIVITIPQQQPITTAPQAAPSANK